MRALAAEHAAEGERDRRLAAPVIEALAAAGVFRMLAPERAGGLEATPRELVEAVEDLAAGDAAAGWIAAVAATSGMVLGYLAQDVAREVLSPATAMIGGVFAPRGRAVQDGDGFRVTGRWPFASGCEHCDWLMGGAVVDGAPAPALFIAPRAAFTIHDTWDVAGLKGTGSHDIELEDVFVPAGRSASLFTDEPIAEGPLYRTPVFGLLAVAIAGVTLGIARGAIEDVLALGAKVPAAGRRSLAERPTVQTEVAQREAALRAARAGLLAATDAGDPLGLRLAAGHAATASADVVTAMYRLGGGTALYASSPLQRRLRDVNAATQHMLVGPTIWELGGRLLFGLPSDTSQL